MPREHELTWYGGTSDFYAEATRVLEKEHATIAESPEAIRRFSDLKELPGVFDAVFSRLTSALREQALQGEILRRLDKIEERLDALEGSNSDVYPVESLFPERYQLARPLRIRLSLEGDTWHAEYLEANIATCGDSRHEAVTNLKSLIVQVYERLSELPPERLGPGPKQQLKLLSSLLGEE